MIAIHPRGCQQTSSTQSRTNSQPVATVLPSNSTNEKLLKSSSPLLSGARSCSHTHMPAICGLILWTNHAHNTRQTNASVRRQRRRCNQPVHCEDGERYNAASAIESTTMAAGKTRQPSAVPSQSSIQCVIAKPFPQRCEGSASLSTACFQIAA